MYVYIFLKLKTHHTIGTMQAAEIPDVYFLS